jgi:hypothetical protein
MSQQISTFPRQLDARIIGARHGAAGLIPMIAAA